MTSPLRILLAAALVLTCATAARAQRVPAADSAAIGGDIGVFLPTDDRLDSGLSLEGFYEYYVSARTSLRFGLGWAEPALAREEDDSLRILRVPFDVVQNWEGGTVHPFLGAGVGVYFLQEKDNGRNVGDAATKLGATLFGGAEFFTGRAAAVKAEVRYHIVDGVRGLEPDGLALTIGLKAYF